MLRERGVEGDGGTAVQVVDVGELGANGVVGLVVDPALIPVGVAEEAHGLEEAIRHAGLEGTMVVLPDGRHVVDAVEVHAGVEHLVGQLVGGERRGLRVRAGEGGRRLGVAGPHTWLKEIEGEISTSCRSVGRLLLLLGAGHVEGVVCITDAAEEAKALGIGRSPKKRLPGQH